MGTTQELTWAERPFDPSCTTFVEMDAETINAVRRVISDWDGSNWAAVREVLRGDGRTPDELRAMSVFDVRMAFAIRQRPMTAAIGGMVETATSAIQTIDLGGNDRNRTQSPGQNATPTAPTIGITAENVVQVCNLLLTHLESSDTETALYFIEEGEPQLPTLDELRLIHAFKRDKTFEVITYNGEPAFNPFESWLLDNGPKEFAEWDVAEEFVLLHRLKTGGALRHFQELLCMYAESHGIDCSPLLDWSFSRAGIDLVKRVLLRIRFAAKAEVHARHNGSGPVIQPPAMTPDGDPAAAFRAVALDLIDENREKDRLLARAGEVDDAAAASSSAPAGQASKPKNDKPARKRGRLSKAESDAKRAYMLAKIRMHATLKDDPAELANIVGVSETTVRRWLDEEEQKYLDSRAANPDPDEE